MIISIPKEIKNNENRVALTPAGAKAFVNAGHRVLVQKDAGAGSGFLDEDYAAEGAEIRAEAEEIWLQADIVMKVKEPLPAEFAHFHEGLILFTYLHLAAEPALARALIDNKVTAIAYETVEEGRTLPLLTPMSEVAGRMSVQIGTQAAKMAVGLGAVVTIIDSSAERLRQLEDLFGFQVQTLMSDPLSIAGAVAESDLVIGAVLIPGAKAPKLVTDEMVKGMMHGSVIIDVAIDQGGIVETANRITTHDNPTYEKYGIIHYAVANMPGAVPRTSTVAVTNATLPYALLIANKGLHEALKDRPGLVPGVNVAGGAVRHAAVAQALGYPCERAEQTLKC